MKNEAFIRVVERTSRLLACKRHLEGTVRQDRLGGIQLKPFTDRLTEVLKPFIITESLTEASLRAIGFDQDKDFCFRPNRGQQVSDYCEPLK